MERRGHYCARHASRKQPLFTVLTSARSQAHGTKLMCEQNHPERVERAFIYGANYNTDIYGDDRPDPLGDSLTPRLQKEFREMQPSTASFDKMSDLVDHVRSCLSVNKTSELKVYCPCVRHSDASHSAQLHDPDASKRQSLEGQEDLDRRRSIRGVYVASVDLVSAFVMMC